MSWGMLLQGILPLVVFAIVDIFAGVKWGVAAAMVIAAIEVGGTWWVSGEIDSTTVVSALLVIVLGGLSWWLDDPRFFKFQPVVLGVAMAGILAWYQWFDTPLMLKLMERQSIMVPPEMREMAANPVVREMISRVSGDLVWFFLIHAALVAWAALRMSTMWWLVIRGVGFYVLLAALMVVEIVRARAGQS